ncbi:hypothetical protein HDU87_001358 [Geranomyces variabilis]|uniref:Uncharacterized protein n=1 Tax=Geranomyces variabilis TaxID=109894 RepID=A0AAD5TSL3_9FUNG|nr:hypothetical protein HDU87_001358 [Geranomyces variabilis]
MALTPQDDATSILDDKFNATEAVFAEQYAAFRSRQFDWNANCLLILRGEEATLLFRPTADAAANQRQKPEKRTFTFTSELFHRLKAICHIPLSVLAIVDGRPSAEWRGDLLALRGQVADIDAALSGPSSTVCFNTAQLSRNQLLLTTTLDFIDNLSPSPPNCPVAETITPTAEALSAYLGRMRPIFEANMFEATSAMLESLDEVVRRILSSEPATHGKRLRVVCFGEHMPANGNMQLQYFLAATQTSNEGEGVYYTAEKLDDDEAVAFVNQHIADGALGAKVFGDFSRMHSDVLAPAAHRILDSWKLSGRVPIEQLIQNREAGAKTMQCPLRY